MLWLFKRKNKKVFKIVYVLSARIDGDNVHFNLRDIMVDYIYSDNHLDAMAKFCKTNVSLPPVYIYKCYEVKIV